MPVIKFLTGDAITPEINAAMQASARSAFNNGSSLGLQYPWVCSNQSVWCRYCGHVLSTHDARRPWEAMEACHAANGLAEYPDAETIAAIDATP